MQTRLKMLPGCIALSLLTLLLAISSAAGEALPAGAAALGYSECIINERPVAADVTLEKNGHYKWFSGQWYAQAPSLDHYATQDGALVLNLGGVLLCRFSRTLVPGSIIQLPLAPKEAGGDGGDQTPPAQRSVRAGAREANQLKADCWRW